VPFLPNDIIGMTVLSSIARGAADEDSNLDVFVITKQKLLHRERYTAGVAEH